MDFGGGLFYLNENSIAYAVTDDAPGSLRVDLAATGFVEPVGLVVLACLLDQAGTLGWPIEFIGPRNRDAASYLSRMGIARIAESVGCAHDLSSVSHRAPEDRFVELSRFGPDDPADDLIELVLARVDEWNEDDLLRGKLYDNFYELGLNIEEHAERPGFLAAQYYPQLDLVQFAVADWGIGVRASLESARHAYPSAGEAIVAAATSRVTRKEGAGGAGLPSVVKDITNWKGEVRIRSGGALVRFRPGEPPRVVERDADLPGTLVSVEVKAYLRGS